MRLCWFCCMALRHDGGHFILDEYLDTAADLIRDFIDRQITTSPTG
jgi:hypothetical protein